METFMNCIAAIAATLLFLFLTAYFIAVWVRVGTATFLKTYDRHKEQKEHGKNQTVNQKDNDENIQTFHDGENN